MSTKLRTCKKFSVILIYGPAGHIKRGNYISKVGPYFTAQYECNATGRTTRYGGTKEVFYFRAEKNSGG